MAQVDTGLGWSAEEDWLINGAGVIANVLQIGSPDYPNQPLPYGVASADYLLSPVYAQNDPGGGVVYKLCFVTTSDEAHVFVFRLPHTSGDSFISCYFISDRPDAVGRVALYRGGGTTLTSVQDTAISTLDSTTGLYYGLYTAGGFSAGFTLDTLPVFNTLRDGLDSISISSSDILKDNAGYAVGCLAKWKTTNGTELISPILISSNTEFVDMTTTATGYTVAKFNDLLSGIRFYMAFWDIPGNSNLTSILQQIDLTDRGNMDLEQLFMTIISTSYAHVIIINSPDPYETEGGESGEEGGDGEETNDDDAGIEAGSDFPSAINTGFCRIFSPSESELRNLSNYLWSNSYDLAQVKKLFSNPMDSILGLSAVPIRLLGSSVSFSLGGVPITGMTLPLVTQQRYTYHMGTITIKERWGSYLDYDPYTKFSIFLPFIGMRELAADDIMGKTVGLVYDIDILTGMCVARLQAGTNCLYEWGGNCAIQLPINSRNWDSVFSTAVSAVGGIVSAVTGGSAPLVAGSVASAALQTVSMKPRIDKSSTIGGAAGWLGQMSPYIIRTTPEAFIPTDQNKFIGYPAYINVGMDTISGYNEVESIHLENVTATGAELEEIESILKGGVIF